MKPLQSTTACLPVLLLALGSATAHAGGSPYDYIQLDTLGGADSVAYGMNDLGQVVGWSTLPGCTTANGNPCRMAYVWQDGVMTPLGKLAADEESFARAINNNGLIVGTSEDNILFGSGTFHAVRWDAGVISALPHLGPDTSVFAHDVNELDMIAGHTVDPSDTRDSAVIWSGGVLNNVGATEPHQYSRGNGLSDAGLLAGFAWNLFSPGDSMVFDGAWTQIGGADGPFQNSEAQDANNAGYVVGFQAFPSGSWHAAYWEPKSKKAIDAGTLPGHDSGELYDINEAGIAVGRSYDSNTVGVSRAVLFDGKQLVDLNDFMPAGSNAVLYEAREINELGDIAGTAVVDGEFRAFVLRAKGPWEDVGFGLAGSAGAPVLEGDGTLQGGTPTTLTVTNALPGAPAWYVLGTNSAFVPFAGGTLVPLPGVVLAPLTVNGVGEVGLPLTWPAGLPAGLTLYWQTWILDASGPQGLTASNGLLSTTP